jgi:hypothetical protein
MNVIFDTPADPQLEWLYHVGPVGLVIGPNVIREDDLTPPHQSAVETEAVKELLSSDRDGPAVADPWAFFERILGWEAQYVAGAPGGPELPDLAAKVAEHELVLSPDLAVRDLDGVRASRAPNGGEPPPLPYQLLVKLHTGVNADSRGALGDGWQASPHQQFERLLRDTSVAMGVLVDRSHLRLIYAPKGETSGWLSFPLRSLGEVPGRAMLGGLKLMLGHSRLFTEPEARRLPKLLARSREAQNKVSAELAEQVLGALHELLRAFHAADPQRIEALAKSDPHHLYEGLLTTLMRLVFLLYAEDRELMPTQRTGAAVEVYEQGYSVRGLYARLVEDRALHPDTMDERVGGWGRLLALFRLVHGGFGSWITARGGKLFDPDAFPFLEGRDAGEPRSPAAVLPIRDGAILRILEGLMTIETKAVTGERVRERLSYRSLDVEQIGSVYEIVMGFKVELASGPMIAIKGEKNLPVFVDIDLLGKKTGADRQKFLKEWGVAPTGRKLDAIKRATSVQELTEALAAICDPRGSPGGHVTAANSPILQPTDERRRTGSHYTPRSLTEPIVRYALEPAFARLGPEATPEQILDLKVCDPAMGSGAFLVEACRALAARLVKAWECWPAQKPANIPDDENENLHAQRLVAQRCLYGVDKNPLATDLAKLSLWLATLARDHEFTFLDHALKSGDSLVGLTEAQIKAVHWDASKLGLPLFQRTVEQCVAEVMKGRAEIQAAPDDTVRAIQEARHRNLEKRIKDVRIIGDAVIAAFFAESKPRARERKRAEVESRLTGSLDAAWDELADVAATLKQGTYQLTPFHWGIEFPEVFARGNAGFDAIIGNPPFLGGSRISTNNGKAYLDWLLTYNEESHGNSDLVAHFFRQSFKLLRASGTVGLIATNTIRQGDTRETGLTAILKDGGSIRRAVRRLQWPGNAAVIVSTVHITKGPTISPMLDGQQVERISAYLVAGSLDASPSQISENDNHVFVGSDLGGMGFTFDDSTTSGIPSSLSDMRRLVDADEHNLDRIFPFIGGEEVNNHPTYAADRYVIDFENFPLRRDAELDSWFSVDDSTRSEWLHVGVVACDYPDSVAGDWPALLSIVEQRVKPVRMSDNSEVSRRLWWHFIRGRRQLYQSIKSLKFILATNRGASPHLGIARLPGGMVYAKTLAIFPFDCFAPLATLQSRVHEIWARFFSSSMKDDLRYVPSDCFNTFPFPRNFKTDLDLESTGRAYHDYRAALMVARDEGMTKTYNRFHNAADTAEDIKRLRELHAAMDRTVLEAYGWRDLAERTEPRFLDETNEDDHTYQGRLFWPADFRDKVLARLLALNAERHAEEVRLGTAPGTRGTAREADDDDLEDATD